MFEPRDILTLVAVIVGAYLAGSVNFSIAAARVLGHGDLRAHGSRNAGATNLSRVAGKPAAVVVLLLDLARAFAVILAARHALPLGWAPAAAIPLLLGNLFPLFHGFKGGKGVAASVGIALALNPPVMLAGGGVFLVVFGISRRVSPGSILMTLSYPVWSYLFFSQPLEVAAFATFAAAILLTHRANIARLLRGEEPALGPRPKASGE